MNSPFHTPQRRYRIVYDFAIGGDATGWNLYKDGVILGKYPSWEAARDERDKLVAAG